jgi:hypothetical protein
MSLISLTPSHDSILLLFYARYLFRNNSIVNDEDYGAKLPYKVAPEEIQKRCLHGSEPIDTALQIWDNGLCEEELIQI